MRSKKCLTILLLTLLVLTGCVGNGRAQPTARPVAFTQPVYDWTTTGGETITIWARDRELNRIYMQRAFERYHQLTGNTVEVVYSPSENFQDDVIHALGGTGPQPDLILSYGGTNIEKMDPDRNFYDFTEAPWVDDLTNMAINQTIYNGKVIGLPHWEASISGTLFNKSLFKRLNIKIPETQTEFMAVCAQLLDAGVTPIYMPFDTDTMMVYQFPLDTVVEAPEILEGLNDGSLRYSDLPEMRTIVEWYATMANRGYFGDYQKNTWDGMSEALRSEDYAMMLCWDTWLYTDFTGDPAQFGLMPAFIGVPEAGTFEGPNLGLMIANKNSPNLDAALNLITFLADPYNYNAAFAGIYTAPVFKGQIASVSTPQYVEAERNVERNFRDSTAWLRIRGFSQSDASCIQTYMLGTEGYSLDQCLADMDTLRENRVFR